MKHFCDICSTDARGEIVYSDGEVLVGCAECILAIAADPAKPIHQIIEYSEDMFIEGINV